MDNLIYFSIIVLGVIGFSVALNICCKKLSQKIMICPLNMKCEQVLYSKYAKFLGIKMEYLGMLYYALIIISYSIFLFWPGLKNSFFVSTISMMTVAGFLFSAYLIFIQAFKLKEWCSWCLMSAAVSTTIFILVLQTNSAFSALSNLAGGYKDLIIISYASTLALGLGISAVMEILLLQFLKDLRISEEECETLHTLRQITWLALGIMTVANYALYLTEPSVLIISSKFLAKTFILGVLLIVSLIYDIFVASKLDKMISSQNVPIVPFIFGPISLGSWFLIFIFEMIKDPELPLIQLLSIYGVILLASLSAGIILKEILTRNIDRV